MFDLKQVVLKLINDSDHINSLDIANNLCLDHQIIIGAVKSLDSSPEFINVEPVAIKKLELTEEGQQIVDHGSYEVILFNSIPDEGIAQDKLKPLVSNYQIGFSKAMANKWIKVDKTAGNLISKIVNQVQDELQQNLYKIKTKGIDIPANLKAEYKKRKLINEVTIKSVDITKGPNFKLSIEKDPTDLTTEMILDDSWKHKNFKHYNFNAMGITPEGGHFHPLMKVKSQFRQIFLEMGFSEMETDKYVESSFWNFDALFQPQNHPARDEHDTFFMEDPKHSCNFPLQYLEKIKKIHSTGGYGSTGYQYEWKIEEAQKNILRTHTTANSARLLYKLAKEGFRPVKYFSIDKVYRNENLDATHLAEFHQIEGIVAGYNLTLGDLMGVLREFYRKLGIHKLKFKPTYNPYTEPSMEIFSYHEGLKKWVEIGNSGIFRPELLLPMGFPPDISVIAWGLSLERPTMILYGVSNIRELVGHKVNLNMVYRSPICFFKE